MTSATASIDRNALAIRLGLVAAVITAMSWLMNDGSRHVVNFFARTFGDFYAVETTSKRAMERHPRLVLGLESMAIRWDEMVEAGDATPMVEILAKANIITFVAGIQHDGWHVPRTGCFHEFGTDDVYIDIDLLRRLSMTGHKARSLAVAYQVSSALASYVQANRPKREGPPGEVYHVVWAREGFERDVLAGRIAGEFFALGGKQSKMPEQLVIDALHIVQREQGYRLHHLGDWVFPGNIDHATIERRAKWFRAGVLEPEVDHEARIYTERIDEL